MILHDIEKVEKSGEIIIVKYDIKGVENAIMIAEVFKENDVDSIYRVHEFDTNNNHYDFYKVV
ncbi:MAG: hypothetical protein DRJ01_05880 [Bacteroidetes bacterium]|nr:MAG: hypothetical protein DRJ01_05880 [Bacteroidota bacterium]